MTLILKSITFILFTIFINHYAFSQVGIGTTNPHSSAMLHLESSSKGFLPPKMTFDQINLIKSPTNGLLVYNISEKCLAVYTIDKWMNVCTQEESFIPSELNDEIILHASDGQTGDRFGYSSSISKSGDIIVIGAYAEDTKGNNAGAAYVFEYNGTTWIEVAILHASNGTTDDNFGRDVNVSNDGNFIFVGASNNLDKGAVYVYEKNGTSWVEKSILYASDGQDDDKFGYSISSNKDGTVLSVGASDEDTKGNDAGAAYIFKYNGTTWIEETILYASDAQADDNLGYKIGLSDNGDIVLISAYNEDTKGVDAGAAYVFKYNGTSWVEDAILHASDGQADDHFGRSLSLNGSGTSLVIGAFQEDTKGSDAGAAYIYKYNNATWTEDTILHASDGETGDEFGRSVYISEDGNTVNVGAHEEDNKGLDAGAAYIFRYNGIIWSEQKILRASDGAAGDQYGRSLSVNKNGNIEVIGAYKESTNGTDAGAVYIYK